MLCIIEWYLGLSPICLISYLLLNQAQDLEAKIFNYSTSNIVYIYIYIYVCVWVCMNV